VDSARGRNGRGLGLSDGWFSSVVYIPVVFTLRDESVAPIEFIRSTFAQGTELDGLFGRVGLG
jgi:hypothetical protein